MAAEQKDPAAALDRRAGKSITSNENPHRELKGKKHEKTSDGTGYSAFFATLAVIVIHMGRIPFVSDCWASGWLPMSIAPYVWCVPVFFMISGRFFLDPAKDIPLKVLFQKYIFRLILAFLLWSAVYTAYYVWDGTYRNLNIFGILTMYIHGPIHFWYLYAAVGLYLLTPLLRKIVQDKTICHYVLVLFVMYNIATQYLIYIPKVGAIVESTVSRLGLESFSGYVGCFLLGYVLYAYQEKITKKWEIAVYVLGALVLVLTYVLDISISDELRPLTLSSSIRSPT
ncbi:MAG: acyltransferase [Oscillospiraceae bacterium]|nr:acyltransferase [Oscillospiraceae bacterium]